MQNTQEIIEAISRLELDEMEHVCTETANLISDRKLEAKKLAKEKIREIAIQAGIAVNFDSDSPNKSGKTSDDKRSMVPPKYRDPDNPSRLWTGRGVAPKWVKNYINNGGSKEDLLIKE